MPAPFHSLTGACTGPTTGPTTASRTAPGRPFGAVRAEFAYGWNNSPRRLMRVTRSALDGRDTPGEVTVSYSPAGGPSLAYVGLPAGRTNILQLLEHQRDPAGPEPVRHTGGGRLRDLAEGRWPDADIVLVGAEAHRLRELPSARSVTAPFRVHLVVDVPADPAELRARISRREREVFRRGTRRHGWGWQEDPSAEAFDEFYRRLHLPTMVRRHGERLRSESRAVARHAILRHGTLFFVTQDGVRVAGVLCHWSPDHRTLTTRLLGVRDGDPEHYASGAFKAAYHLLLAWACEHGVPHVDFFGTEAFVSKGIFQWKRRFGPRVELPPNHFASKRLRLYVRRDTPAVRDFLVANPLLTVAAPGTSGLLAPVYFADRDRPARLDLSSRCAGLPEPRVLDLDDFLTSAPRASPITGAS